MRYDIIQTKITFSFAFLCSLSSSSGIRALLLPSPEKMVLSGDKNKTSAGDKLFGEAALLTAVRNLEQRSTFHDECLDKIGSSLQSVQESLASIIQTLSGLGLDSLPPRQPLVNASHQCDPRQIDLSKKGHSALQQGQPSNQPHHDSLQYQDSALDNRNLVHHSRVKPLPYSSSPTDFRNHKNSNYDSEDSDEEQLQFNQWKFRSRHSHHNDTFRFKIDLPQFDGELEMENLLDWLKQVDNYFDYTHTPDDSKVKLVAYKLTGGASAWWDQEQSLRRRIGKPPIRTWQG